MSTSRTTGLYEPTGATKIQTGTLGYICARNRQRAYDLVVKEFKKSRLTQADLAKRLGKAPEIISRLLNRPRNWELDTFSELLFGISGAVPKFTADFPLSTTASVVLTDAPSLTSSTASASSDTIVSSTSWTAATAIRAPIRTETKEQVRRVA